MPHNYQLERLDTDGAAVDTAYLLEWNETEYAELEKYLTANEFETTEGFDDVGDQGVARFVYEEDVPSGDTELRAEAWLDPQNGTAALKVCKEIFDEEPDTYDDLEAPMPLQGVMEKHDAVNLNGYLDETIDAQEVVDPEAVEDLKEAYDQPSGGVVTSGSPRL